MYSIIRWIGNTFSSIFVPNDIKEELRAAVEALNADEDSEDKEDEKIEEIIDYSDYTYRHKTGKVTSVSDNKIVIDDIYFYESSELSVAVGTKVSFTVHEENKTVKVSNIELLDNDWGTEIEQKTGKWCYRTIVEKITKRIGRKLYLESDSMVIDLNQVSSEFIPISGDWIQIEAKCEIDEYKDNLAGAVIEVVQISPLRPKIITGVIKAWNSNLQIGQINMDVFFNRDSLCTGYLPRSGDKIVTEVIESEQGHCNWRSLKIVPNFDGKPVKSININNYKVESELEDPEISINDEVNVDFKNFNERASFQFKIINNNNENVVLTSISSENMSAVISFDYPDKYPLVLEPKQQIIVIGNAVIKTAGSSKEYITFTFEHCILRRHLITNLNDRNNGYCSRNKYNQSSLLYNTKNYRNNLKQGSINAGRNNNTPRFVHFRLPSYNVPEALWNIMMNEAIESKDSVLEALKRAKVALRNPLSYQYYEDRFHSLLYLEEVNETIQMRKYDRERAVFIRNGEYLMLEIENLSEQRPSILLGDAIIATNPDRPNDKPFRGDVEKVGVKHLFLKFYENFRNNYNNEDYSITVKQSRSKIMRLHHGVTSAMRNLGRDVLFPTKIIDKPPLVNFHYDEFQREKSPVKYPGPLTPQQIKNIVLGSKTQNKIETKDYDCNNQLELKWFNRLLNRHQKYAVINCLHAVCRPLPYIIFGPPGTGKTVTLVEVILQTLRMIPHSRILVATPSNTAANLITLRLINSGVLKPGDIVRLVAYKCLTDNSISDKLAPYCATISIGLQGSGSHVPSVTSKGLTLGIDASTVGRHRITVSTCSTIGSLYSLALPKGHFTHVMVDEAGQATEPEIMIPLSFLDKENGQCVLAGDPQQLGPVISSSYAKAFGFDESYLERMINRFPYVRDPIGFPDSEGYDRRVVTKLILNYRSLPSILDISNKLFYHSELKSMISCVDSPQVEILRKLESILPRQNGDEVPSPFVFHGVNGNNRQSGDSPSWFNFEEVSQVWNYVNELYRNNMDSSDIGIITPYIQQVKMIRSILYEANLDIPKIGTVEDMQGQEFNVVIVSTVRSSKDIVQNDISHNLGFVAQPKRMNVALTRAKALLIIIGSPFLLINDHSWRHVITHAIKSKAYLGCPLPDSFLQDIINE